MRREWIEMHLGTLCECVGISLPPCGGSGLKFFRFIFFPPRLKSPSMRREWIEMLIEAAKKVAEKSPSMRREWIEMIHFFPSSSESIVSLHAEGVD